MLILVTREFRDKEHNYKHRRPGDVLDVVDEKRAKELVRLGFARGVEIIRVESEEVKKKPNNKK